MLARDLGLDSLLAALREAGLPVGYTELDRLRTVFDLEPRLSSTPELSSERRLAAILRAVLVKSDEHCKLFDHLFETWISRAEQSLVEAAPSGVSTAQKATWSAPHQTFRPQKQKRLWVKTLMVLAVLVSCLAPAVLGPHTALSPRPIVPTEMPTAATEIASPGGAIPTPGELPRLTFSTWVPTLKVTPGEPVWSGWVPFALSLVALGNAGALWAAVHRRRRFPPLVPQPTVKGPRRVFLSPAPLRGPQLLSLREGEALVWGIGQFVAEEPTRRLDLPATVRATAKAAGIPVLRFHQARYPHEVWLWMDEAAQDRTLPRITEEVVTALRSHGLPVERAHFRGLPDWLARNNGQGFAPSEVDERRDAAVVAILTDGRLLARHAEADDLRPRLDALLRSLSYWPRLAFVDFSRRTSGMAPILARHHIRRIEPHEMAAFLGDDRSAGATAPAALGDDLVWAAACALAPTSVDEERAFEIRQHLGLQVSPWALQQILAEAPGPPGRLLWAPDKRALRLNWLRGAEAQPEGTGQGASRRATESLLGRTLTFWEEAYNRELRFWDEGSRERRAQSTPAEQHLIMERALVRLWRNPGQAARELYSLFGGDLRAEIELQLGALAPLNYGGKEHAHLPWGWEKPSGIERTMLQEMGLGGGMPRATLRAPGRLWVGLGICVGLAAASFVVAAKSGTLPPSGPIELQSDPGRPPDAKEVMLPVWKGQDSKFLVRILTTKWEEEALAPQGAKVSVTWEKRPVPCVSREGSSLILRCGTLLDPLRVKHLPLPIADPSPMRRVKSTIEEFLNAIGINAVKNRANLGFSRTVFALTARSDDKRAQELAVSLLDSGSADVVLIDSRPQDLALALGVPEYTFIIPESRWSELSKALRFVGTRPLTQVWPKLRHIAKGYDPLLRGTEDTDFIRIPPGSFMMGSKWAEADADRDEMPAHRVKVSDFLLSRFEVTERQFRGSLFDSRPATNVTWMEARSYCEKHGWRLPTEAEWEYASRAGTEARWSFGDREDSLDKYAWHKSNSGSRANTVGTRAPNPWGLYDMHGNAWEWVADWYAPYSLEVQENPLGPASGKKRVLRGGSFNYSAWYQRSADRFGYPPAFRSSSIGFRCARDLKNQP